ncbi:MFS transporter [Paenibacillus sp. GCM10023252]|uniref:MFS transporter n=1 Tax=Paenibacillus sp. GCM10023252 TaxID=3252649 RepID=UPI003621F5AC
MTRLIRIAILSISLLTVMAGAAVAPALGSIGEFYTGVDPLLIKMILTLPSLVIIPASLLSGRWAPVLGKKQLLLAGIALYVIGGVGGGFTDHIATLLLFRGILGLGVGIIMPLSTGLIAELFSGEDRTRMMGYSTAVNNLGGIIATVLSGFLATVSWRMSFGVYLLGLLVLVLIAVALPRLEKQPAGSTSFTSLPMGSLSLMMTAGFFISIIFYTVPTNLSLYIEGRGLGSAQTSGLLISSMTFASFLSGMLLSRVTKWLGRQLVVVSLASMAAGFGLLAFTNHLVPIVGGLLLVGLGLGLLMPTLFLTTSKSVKPPQITFALSLVSSSMFLGQFLSPLLAGLFGSSVEAPYQFSMTLALAAMLVVWLMSRRRAGQPAVSR